MILDFKLTPRAVKERQYRAFRRDFPGYDVDYIFGRQPVVPDTRPVGTPVEAKQP
jgi:hypothetical protein